ncbi:MAG: type VI secretion system protein TssA [Bacteroidetes bacterium]|nr:type VI secretion system protein TssA [Bacteroidota bacterium]
MENSTVSAVIEPFLEPISEDNPTGEWLRYEAIYDNIQEARREDDPTLDQGVWQKSLKKADWTLTQKLCSEALLTKSKDLQIAIWLFESWMNIRGFEGIDNGITLASELCYKYWDTLYPALEEHDVEYRTAPLQWLNEKLFHKPKSIQCTKPRSRDIPSYNFIDWESVLTLENTLRKNPFSIEPEELENRLTREKYRESMLNTPIEYYTNLSQILGHIQQTLSDFEKFLDEKCGKQSPSFKLFRDVIGKIERFTSDILKERAAELIVPEPEIEVEEITEDETEYYEESGISDDNSSLYTAHESPKNAVKQATAPIRVQETERKIMQNMSNTVRTREDAYRRLNEAADFLLKNEPHSPVPYLIKRAISWGDMPLPQLLNELVFDPNDRNAIFGLLGMPPMSAPPEPAVTASTASEW